VPEPTSKYVTTPYTDMYAAARLVVEGCMRSIHWSVYGVQWAKTSDASEAGRTACDQPVIRHKITYLRHFWRFFDVWWT